MGIRARFLMPNRGGANLLLNPGFETGGTGGDFNGGAEIDDGTSDDFDNWSNYYVDDGAGNKVEATGPPRVQAGSVALKMTCTTAYTSIGQTITVIPGARYEFLFGTRGDGAKAGSYNVWDVSNAANIIPVTGTGVPGVVYTQVTGYFTAPGECTSARFLLYSPLAAGVCYFDDVSVY